MEKFSSSANQYVNSSNESCTLVEYFLTNVLYIFLAQTQVHNYSCLNLLRRISNTVFRFQVTSFARSPFCTKCTVKCGAKVSCASVEAVGGAYMNIHEFHGHARGTAHSSSRSSFLSRFNGLFQKR